MLYVPMTMDELMARFVLNMERANKKEEFLTHEGKFSNKNLLNLPGDTIEAAVTNSVKTLAALANSKFIDESREKTQENKIYLKCLAKSTKRHGLTTIKAREDHQLTVVKKKPIQH